MAKQSDRLSLMPFPDDHHIARLISALWNRAPAGRATVLVGAGFSQNAQPLRQGLPSMPTWTALAERMIESLYAGNGTSETWRGDHARRLSPATSEALRIAQEYETEFGRMALDRLIAENVPDDAFGPGELHHLLMDLPWADVLTTNWDTLLERTASALERQVYSVVHVPEDIPGAPRPRIVKLHGTLPSHRPFIFTEDDFRTYPERFASFLNLARQTTMENVLVLIGFSGDDPNFLYWSGWVRDQLGPHAPTIYLVGPLDLSSARRKMLERRGVQPIDLVRLESYQTWPIETRRSLAVRWFLERLTAAEPFPRVRWPHTPVRTTDRLKTIDPQKDPTAPLNMPLGVEAWTVEVIANEIAPTLKHNRLIYPGWVVAPKRARQQIWSFLQSSIAPAADILSELAPDLALSLAYEINWLCETALLPLFDNLEAPIRHLLKSMDLSVLAGESRTQAIELTLALIRSDRETDGMESAEQLDALVTPHIVDPEHLGRLHYERSLRALNTLDYDRLDSALREWPDTGAPFWAVRKASLLAENGRVDEARSILILAISTIRTRTDKRAEDIASWSQEAYALLLRLFASRNTPKDWEDREAFVDRMRILAAEGGDASEEREWFVTELSYPPPAIPADVQETRGFDIGQVTRTQHWSAHSPIVYRRQALEAMRFLEEAGHPARIDFVAGAAPILAGASKWFMGLDATRTMCALSRTGGSAKDVIDVVFSRDAIADFDDEFAIKWGIRLLNGVRMLAKRLDDPILARSAQTRLGLLVELLSRLVLRLPSFAPDVLDFATSSLEKAIHPSLEKPFKSLAHRAFDALPNEMISVYRRRLFETTVPITQNGYYSDVAEVAVPKNEEKPDPALDTVIRDTITKVYDANRRYAASARLQWLQSTGMLTEAQTKIYADALWYPTFLDADGLPGHTPLRPWVFALLPHPENATPAATVKARLLALTHLDSDEALGTISSIIVRDQPPVTLTVAELKPFIVMLLKSAQPKPKESAGIFSLFSNSIEKDHDFWGMFDGLIELALKHAALRKVIAGYFRNMPQPASSISVAKCLAVGIMKSEPAEALLCDAWMSSGYAVVAAARGSVDWLKSAPKGTPLPPLVWDIASESVIALSGEAVLPALDFLRAAYSDYPDAVPAYLDDRLTRALHSLLRRTATGVRHTILDFDPAFARQQGAKLVVEMAGARRAPQKLLEAWQDAAKNERIPEISKMLSDLPIFPHIDG